MLPQVGTPVAAGVAKRLAAICEALSEAADADELARQALRAAAEVAGARRTELWRREAGQERLEAGWPDETETTPVSPTSGTAEQAAADGPWEEDRGHAAPGGMPPSAHAVPERVDIPLRACGETLGRLVVIEPRRPGPWLELVAAHTAVCLAHLEARQSLRRTVLQMVTAFSELVESRDQYTEAHSLHIAELALQVGLRLGLDPARFDSLIYAALLHDLGKVGVPDAILLKPGALSEAEWETMRRHPSIGRRALERIDLLRDAAEIVEQHHERFDGNGYPHGLAGEAIRIEARIIAVVDAFDAMTTTRPYRPALSRAQALAELRRCAGSQFDPRVVEALLSVVGP